MEVNYGLGQDSHLKTVCSECGSLNSVIVSDIAADLAFLDTTCYDIVPSRVFIALGIYWRYSGSNPI